MAIRLRCEATRASTTAVSAGSFPRFIPRPAITTSIPSLRSAPIARSGDPPPTPRRWYYSFDLGGWHIVSLDSVTYAKGGETAAKQLSRFKTDLAANPKQPTFVDPHFPLFSRAKHCGNAKMKPLWEAIYAHGPAIVINGHNHVYERFEPLDPNGNPVPETQGIQEFVVCPGGAKPVDKQTVAVELAARGHRVHLSTTDPAAHVADDHRPRRATRPRVSRIDPAVGDAGLQRRGARRRRANARRPRPRTCSKRTSAPRARRRSRSSARSRAPWPRARTASSSSTRRRPATRCCCWMRREAYHREVSRTQGDVPDAVRAAAAATARPAVHEGPAGDAARGHAGPRSGAAAGRPAARRHRAVRLGRQPELRR